ncbi:MAG: hypothetical protein WCC57_07380, partial [Paracoccaceae bacterium]
SGILNPHLDLLPDTEMGLLARIRAGFRLGKRTELLADLVQLVGEYGPSEEATYFERHIPF